MHELLTSAQMYQADDLTAQRGVPEMTLMENAGRAVFEEIKKRFSPCNTLVLCGPGNNGGDGYVIARHLAEAGWTVTVMQFAGTEAFGETAASMAQKWDGAVEDLSADIPMKCSLVIDAIFGAGLVRPIDGELADIVNRINAAKCHVVSVDMPSGVDGNTGAVLGESIRADLTVTFFRKKLGHVLMPGLDRCGETVCRDIGISDTVLPDIASAYPRENAPCLWQDTFPQKRLAQHKYDHGHVVVVSGGLRRAGAARLSANAAQRSGAGAVTLATPGQALLAHAAQINEIMLAKIDEIDAFEAILSDIRVRAVVIGPGNGIGEKTRAHVLMALRSNAGVVLDADALTSFEDQQKQLYKAVADRKAPTVLTPHAGEFSRLFPTIRPGCKLQMTKAAAKLSGGIVVLKGADTVIATPGGRVVISTMASPWLATAGAGDVLAGCIGGLVARGMPGLDAACAGCWVHGRAGSIFGAGLIAGDIIDHIPIVLSELASP